MGMLESNLQTIQKQIYENKLEKGFNVSNIELEFCLTQGELAEAYDAYRKKLPTIGEELADVAIYLYGLAEILGYDLNKEIEKKVKKNRARAYKLVNGVKIKEE
jgi:NTP pyrophosphatase (non-canonical NTP hydrolase)